MLGIQHWFFQEFGQGIILFHQVQFKYVFYAFFLFGLGLGDFFGSPGYVFPAGDAENQVCVGYLFGIYYGTFTLESVGTISSGLGYGTLIDLFHCGQYDVILMILHRIQVCAVGIFAGVYFF